MHRWTGSALVQVKACRLIVNCAIRSRLHWNLIGIQSFSFKNMCLKISQRNFRSGDLLIYIISRLIWYIWYVMQAKCWWPYLGHKINSQCNRVWHNTLPPYAASRWLCYLFIAIPTSQGMPTNMIEIFPFVTDRVDIMCSIHILSVDTTQRRWRSCFICHRSIFPPMAPFIY